VRIYGFPPVQPVHLTQNSGLKKADLAALICKQVDHWPTPPFNPSKSSITAMKNALLDPANGFLKQGPLDTEWSSPLTSAPATPRPFSRDSEHTSTNVQPEEAMGEHSKVGSNSLFTSFLVSMLTASKDHDFIQISLLLEDRRFDPARKSAVRITVGTVEPGNRDQHVSAKEVIHELQCSHSALAGAQFINKHLLILLFFSRPCQAWVPLPT